MNMYLQKEIPGKEPVTPIAPPPELVPPTEKPEPVTPEPMVAPSLPEVEPVKEN